MAAEGRDPPGIYPERAAFLPGADAAEIRRRRLRRGIPGTGGRPVGLRMRTAEPGPGDRVRPLPAGQGNGIRPFLPRGGGKAGIPAGKAAGPFLPFRPGRYRAAAAHPGRGIQPGPRAARAADPPGLLPGAVPGADGRADPGCDSGAARTDRKPRNGAGKLRDRPGDTAAGGILPGNGRKDRRMRVAAGRRIGGSIRGHRRAGRLRPAAAGKRRTGRLLRPGGQGRPEAGEPAVREG